MYEGPAIPTPIMRNLYRSPLKDSIPIFIATNSAPKTEVSIVACCFENHCTSAVFIKTKKPEREWRVRFSPVWSLSTYSHRSTSFPRGSGALLGIDSSTFP